MVLSPCANLALVLLFALALSGGLWTVWIKTPITPRVVIAFIALMAMAAFDVALIINQQPHHALHKNEAQGVPIP